MAVKFGRNDWLLGFYLQEMNAYLTGTVLTTVEGIPYSEASPLPVALQASPASAAFNPDGEATLAVTTTSARVALGSDGPTAFVVNTGANTAYVRFGSASVVADATLGHPVPPGWGIPFDTDGGSYIAAITASSTAALLISTGTGNPGVVGGTAASGGSSVAVTSVIAGTGATNLGKAEDAVHTTGDVGVMALGVVTDGATSLAAAGDYSVIGTDAAGNVRVRVQAATTGGASFLNIAAGQATTVVKSGAGTLYAIILNSAATATNTTTIYDNTAASGTVIGRPAVTTATIPTTLNYGGDVGLAFATGLTIITATANGGDMTVIFK